MRGPIQLIRLWWWLLAIGTVVGFAIGLFVDPPFTGPLTGSEDDGRKVYGQIPWWKVAVFFAVMGFLVSCGSVWVLEEIRGVKKTDDQ